MPFSAGCRPRHHYHCHHRRHHNHHRSSLRHCSRKLPSLPVKRSFGSHFVRAQDPSPLLQESKRAKSTRGRWVGGPVLRLARVKIAIRTCSSGSGGTIILSFSPWSIPSLASSPSRPRPPIAILFPPPAPPAVVFMELFVIGFLIIHIAAATSVNIAAANTAILTAIRLLPSPSVVCPKFAEVARYSSFLAN